MIKGYDITARIIRDSYDRRAQQLKNDIINLLKKVGVPDDDVEIELKNGRMRVAAEAAWYFQGEHLFLSYQNQGKYVENLDIVYKIIEIEVNLLLAREKTPEEFIRVFSEDRDIGKQRLGARKTLGVDAECRDLDLINKKYKELARTHHPDMGGEMEFFKKINAAHKILRKELE